MSKSPRQHLFFADLIRASAAIGVVVLHTMDPIYFRPDFFGGKVWWLTHLVGMLCRSSVPLFIMLSGYLILNRKRTIPAMWQKTWRRIVVPGLYALLIYAVFDLVTGRLVGSPLGMLGALVDRINMNTSSHLFFLVVLFYLYLATPFLDVLFAYSQKVQLKFIAALFALTILSLGAYYITFDSNPSVYNSYTTWIFYLGYYLFGYYARAVSWSPLRTKIATLALVMAYVVGVVGSYLDYAQRSNLVLAEIPYFSHYFSITIIAQSLALFVLLVKGRISNLVQKFSSLSRVVQIIAANSFGLYLYHLLIMYAFDFNINTFPGGNLLVFLVFSTSSIILVTFLLTVMIRRFHLLFLLGETK